MEWRTLQEFRSYVQTFIGLLSSWAALSGPGRSQSGRNLVMDNFIIIIRVGGVKSVFDYISLSQRLFLFNIGNHFQRFIADSDLDVFNWAGSVRSYLFCIQVEQFIQSLPDTFLLDFAALGQKLYNKQLIPDSWQFLHVTSHWGTKVEVEVSREKHVFDDSLCGHFPQ